MHAKGCRMQFEKKLKMNPFDLHLGHKGHFEFTYVLGQFLLYPACTTSIACGYVVDT